MRSDSAELQTRSDWTNVSRFLSESMQYTRTGITVSAVPLELSQRLERGREICVKIIEMGPYIKELPIVQEILDKCRRKDAANWEASMQGSWAEIFTHAGQTSQSLDSIAMCKGEWPQEAVEDVESYFGRVYTFFDSVPYPPL